MGTGATSHAVSDPLNREAAAPVQATPLQLIKDALEGANFSAATDPSQTTPTAKISVAKVLGRGLSWASRVGRALNSERIALHVSEQVLPLAIAWLGAKVAPLAIKVQATGAGLEDLTALLGGVAGFAVAELAINARRRYVDQVADKRIFRALHEDILHTGIALSPALLEQGAVQNKITKARENLWPLAQHVNSFFSGSASVVGLGITAAALIPVSPQLATVAGLIGVWRIIQAHRYGNERTITEDVLAEPRRQMWYSGWPLRDPEGLQGMKHLVRAGIAAKKNVHEMKQIDDAGLLLERRQTTRSLFSDAGVVATTTAATAYGLFSYISGDLKLDAALFVGAAAALFATKVKSFSDSVGQWVSTKGLVENVHALIELSATTAKRQRELPPAEIKHFTSAPGIKLEDVSVSVEAKKKDEPAGRTLSILQHISLDVKPGEFIGIVGGSGAGKTTLVKLLLGAIDASGGNVEIGSRPIQDIPLAELRANTGYLPQKFWNYMGRTIQANIAIGNPIWDEDASIENAVRDSGLAELMQRNHFGLDTVIGPEFTNGRNLSGGEGHLVALARSLAKQGKILVLDEPTNGLDPDIAQSVVEHVRELDGVTRLLVSHDMGLVRGCDRILVLAKQNAEDDNSPGQIEAFGTHDELMERSETYRRFFSGQASQFEPRPRSGLDSDGFAANNPA